MKTNTNINTAMPVKFGVIISASLLIAGNVLGVGILALPIKLGISGYPPSVLDVIVICSVMLITAFIIAARIPTDQEHFDIPSFFHQELGIAGYRIAVVCNLILLYGVLIAYLSGISSILHSLFYFRTPQWIIIIGYFFVAISLLVFGRKILRRGNTVLLIVIFICFSTLVISGPQHFNINLLSYKHWSYLPLGLPIAVSAFHFHNIIPTVANYVKRNQKALRIAIAIGIGIGLIMNLAWLTITLGTLPTYSSHGESITKAFLHSVPAIIPMAHILHSKIFTISSLLFAVLAVTASFVANGAGLLGFIKDLLFTYSNITNRFVIAAYAFLPPLIATLIYPRIFLSALDIVGGVGETMLFIILPGLILIKITHNKSKILTTIGSTISLFGLFIMLFVISQKLGLINLGIS